MSKLMIICSGVLVFSFFSRTFAQDLREEPGFGLKIGLNNSNVWDEQGEGFVADPKRGLAAGAFASIPFGEFLGLQPEVMLSQKGFQGSGTFLGTSYSSVRTTTFLDVPINIQIKPTEFLVITLGPQYSFLLNQKDEYSFGSGSVAQDQDFENDNLRKNIFGFSAGADILVNRVVLSGRFGWDLQTNNGDGTSSNPRYKNQWIQLAVGYRF